MASPLTLATLFPGRRLPDMQGKQRKLWDTACFFLCDAPLVPIDMKALYVVGTLRELASAARLFLDSAVPRPFASFMVLSSAAELLGTCLDSTSTGNGRRAKRGLHWVAHPHWDPPGLGWSDEDVVLTADDRQYTVGHCWSLRNFCTHGQADPQGMKGALMGREFVPTLVDAFATALNRYWQVLGEEDQALEQLAKANVTPVMVDGAVIHVDDLYTQLVVHGGSPGTF
jgi:hypothetical protein